MSETRRRRGPRIPRTARRRMKRLAERAGERALRAGINAVARAQRDPNTLVGTTPYDVVARDGKLEVRRYKLEADIPPEPRRRIPVLLVPPLMVKPFVFDLTEERSLARHLLAAGRDVFLVDFGEPGPEDEANRLEDYVQRWLPAALDATLQASGADRAVVAGYCQGGLFALMAAGLGAHDGIGAIVTIGSPIDAHRMGVIHLAAETFFEPTMFISKQLGNVPGPLSSLAFRALTPVKSVTRYVDLIRHMHDDDWVDAFDARNQWITQFIPYPGEAFRQLMQDFMRDNGLVEGTLKLGGQAVDLGAVDVPLLVWAGARDIVVPPEAVEPITDVAGSEDISYRLAPGGHMAVLAGREAPHAVWAPTVEWIERRFL